MEKTKTNKQKEKLFKPVFYWFALMFLILKLETIHKDRDRIRIEGEGQSLK